MNGLTRLVPILIALTSILLFFLFPNWGEINLIFGLSVGVIGFGITFIHDSATVRKLASILPLPVVVLWFYAEPGFEPIAACISTLAIYPRKAVNRKEQEAHKSKPPPYKQDKRGNGPLFLKSIYDASEPIGWVMASTAILIAVSIVINEGTSPLTISFTIFLLSGIGVALSFLVGLVFDRVVATKGVPIKTAIYIGVPMTFVIAMAIDSKLTETIGASLTAFTVEAIGGGAIGALIGACIGSFIGLWIEKSEEFESDYPEGSWERGREIAIKTFKNRMSKYSWRREEVQIDEFNIDKGKGTLNVTIVEAKPEPFDNFRWWPVDRYMLLIDRSGDILDMKALTVKPEERYKPIPLDQYGLGGAIRGKRGLELSNIVPTTKITRDGLLVQIEFLVTNHNGPTRIFPLVEYQVAEMKSGNYKERKIQSPDGWAVNLDGNSVTPIRFDAVYEATTLLLTKSPNKVTVKLGKKPLR